MCAAQAHYESIEIVHEPAIALELPGFVRPAAASGIDTAIARVRGAGTGADALTCVLTHLASAFDLVFMASFDDGCLSPLRFSGQSAFPEDAGRVAAFTHYRPMMDCGYFAVGAPATIADIEMSRSVCPVVESEIVSMGVPVHGEVCYLIWGCRWQHRQTPDEDRWPLLLDELSDKLDRLFLTSNRRLAGRRGYTNSDIGL